MSGCSCTISNRTCGRQQYFASISSVGAFNFTIPLYLAQHLLPNLLCCSLRIKMTFMLYILHLSYKPKSPRIPWRNFAFSPPIRIRCHLNTRWISFRFPFVILHLHGHHTLVDRSLFNFHTVPICLIHSPPICFLCESIFVLQTACELAPATTFQVLIVAITFLDPCAKSYSV